MPDEPMEPPYVALADFAARHGIHPMLTRIALFQGWLELAKSRLVDGETVRTLGLWGQAQFYALYHEQVGFQPCPACPHGVKVPERVEQASLF